MTDSDGVSSGRALLTEDSRRKVVPFSPIDRPGNPADNRGAQRIPLLTRWPDVTTQKPNDGRPFSAAGQKLDDVIGDAARRIEEETKQLIAYINDEVVPLVRQHSTTGLRVASDKLKELADYMESATQQKKG